MRVSARKLRTRRPSGDDFFIYKSTDISIAKDCKTMENIERRYVGQFDTTEAAEAELLGVEERADDSSGEKKTYIVGYAATFNQNSVLLGDFIERISPTAFDILKTGKDEAGKPIETRGLFNHDPNFLLGRYPGTMNLSVDEKGLRYEILLPDSSDARGIAASIRRGDLRGSSFSFVVSSDGGEKWTYEGGQSIRTVLKVKSIVDCGPVTFPAYDSASCAIAQRSYRAFCATGAGGGLDNSCGTGGGGATPISDKSWKAGGAHPLDGKTAWKQGAALGYTVGAIAGMHVGAPLTVGAIGGAIGGVAGSFVGRVLKSKYKATGTDVKDFEKIGEILFQELVVRPVSGGIDATGNQVKVKVRSRKDGGVDVDFSPSHPAGVLPPPKVLAAAKAVLTKANLSRRAIALREFAESRAFCATGAGGGLDNSCSTGGGATPKEDSAWRAGAAVGATTGAGILAGILGGPAVIAGSVIGGVIGAVAGMHGDRYARDLKQRYKTTGTSLESFGKAGRIISPQLVVVPVKGGIDAKGRDVLVKVRSRKDGGVDVNFSPTSKTAVLPSGKVLAAAKSVFVKASKRSISKSKRAFRPTIDVPFSKAAHAKKVLELRQFLVARRAFCPTGAGGGLDNSCGGGVAPIVAGPIGSAPRGKFLKWEPGDHLDDAKTAEAQKFISDAHDDHMSIGGKSGGMADAGGGVQTWSKGDHYPWVVSVVGKDSGYVHAQHPAGGKTTKFKFEKGDYDAAMQKVADEIAVHKKKAE